MENREEKILLLQEQLKRIDTRQGEESIRELNRKISDLNNAIGRYSHQINESYKKLKETMAEIEKARKLNEEKDFTSDIKAILDHPLVENMATNIDNNYKNVIIETDYIDIYDEDGNKYLGNKYRLKFDYKYMDVTIYGLDEEYNRKSYWTIHDPHPHVDGDGGYPCLGNAGSMLCQSMNEFELYASFIVILNFLQQVNTEDVAGKYIRNWDCVDENGEIIDNPHELEMYICELCQHETDDEDEMYLCEDCGNRICGDCSNYVIDYGRVCESCLEENYFYCSHCYEYYPNEEERIEINDITYCKHCADNNFSRCEICGTYLREKDEFEIEDNKYCEDCYDNLTVECEHCGDRILREDSNEELGIYYCNDCWEEIFNTEEEEIEEEEGNI